MTTAFCNALRRNPCPTYSELLQAMHAELRRGGMSQRPQLSSSQRFGFDRPFLLTDIVTNTNPQVQRCLRVLLLACAFGRLVCYIVVRDCTYRFKISISAHVKFKLGVSDAF